MRPIQLRTYAIAFIISLFLFGTGILAGLYFSQGLVNSLSSDISDVSERATEIELLGLLDNGSNFCSIYHGQLQSFDAQTTEIDRRVDLLGKASPTDPNFLRLKLDFTLMEARDYLLVERINSQCPSKVGTVLFFYTNDNCPDCTRQGDVGPQVKKDYPNVMIYAFDAGLNSPLVAALQEEYNVTAYPSLVINGNTTSGFVPLSEVERQLNNTG